MPKLNMTVLHRLTQDEAATRIKGLLNEVKAQFADKISDLHEEWDSNTGKYSFSAMGFPVSGTVAVKATQVEIAGDLPFAAILFKKKIEDTIKDRAETLFA